MRRLVLLAMTFAISSCGGSSNRANITIEAMPQGSTFTGVWQSPQYGNMHLCQSGSAVVGDFEENERTGRIQGTIQGNTLRFQWEEERERVVGLRQTSRGRGYFQLRIGDDQATYILGQWGHDESDHDGGPWNAVMLRNRRPTRCLSMDSSS